MLFRFRFRTYSLFLCFPMLACALPPLVEELRPINEKLDPGYADLPLVMQAMGKTAATLSPDERKALGEFALQLKKPFEAEIAFQHYSNQKAKCEADISTGKAQLKELARNPPRSIGGGINEDLRGLLERKANSIIERGEYDFAYEVKYGNGFLGSIGGERGLAFIEFMAGKTVRELEATNSAAAAQLRAGRADLALALAASMFGVADRQQLALNFHPALSYIWVRMKKMTPAQRMEAQDRARQKLIGHVAIHEGAKMVNGVSAEVFYDSVKAGDVLGAGLSLAVLNAGMEEQARRDQQINACLEILFFQPEPSDYPVKMRRALDKLLEPVSGKSVEERLAAKVVKDVIQAISPELATDPVAEAMVGVLKAGFEAAQK